MSPPRVYIDQLAFMFYNGLSLPEGNKAIGVVKPLETKGEYAIIRIGETTNNNAEQGGIHQLRSGEYKESWWRTEVFVDIIIIEPHDLFGTNTYTLIAEASQRTWQEIRNLNLYHTDFEVIDYWLTDQSTPELGDANADTQVVKSTISTVVEWAELWQRVGV